MILAWEYDKYENLMGRYSKNKCGDGKKLKY